MKVVIGVAAITIGIASAPALISEAELVVWGLKQTSSSAVTLMLMLQNLITTIHGRRVAARHRHHHCNGWWARGVREGGRLGSAHVPRIADI